MRIEKAEGKTSSGGKPFWRVLGDGKWYTVWDKKLGPLMLALKVVLTKVERREEGRN